jgi:hypothetical protein
MATSNLPLISISLGSANPYDVAKFLRDFADVLESQTDMGERITQYSRGNSESGCGGTAKIKWSRTQEDEHKFVQFKVLGEPKPYGEIREVCGMTFSTEEIRTLSEE